MSESFSFDGTEYTVTDLKVESENNVFDMFSCRLNGPSTSVRSTIGHGGHLLASHEVLINDKDGTQIFGGFLEWVEQDGVDLILKGRDYKVLLLDERTPRDAQWINQTGATIITALVAYSTKVSTGTITYSDTLSGTARFSHENLLRAIATICSQNDKDFWVWNDSGTLKLDVGARGSGSVGSPNATYSAGIETEIAAETKVTMKVVNRQRVFGAGDGINQIQVCVPWIDINEPDNDRSQGFDGSNADCTHAVATTSQGDVGVMEGKPYVDTGIVSTDIAIATAKAILDVAAPVASVKTLNVDFLKYVTGDGLGDWIRIIDRKQGVDSTLRVKKIMRNLEDKVIGMEFYTPEEDISQALARIERDYDLSNLNGLGATNLIIVNFPDICDNTTPYEMWFELPSEVIFINRIKLTYIVDDYRAFSATTSGGSAHSHGIDINQPTLTAASGSDIAYIGVQTQSGPINKFVCASNVSNVQSDLAESAHTHGVDFTIAKQGDSLTDVAIWVDDGAGFVDKTSDIETDIGHALGTSSESDIPMVAYITATTDLKKIRIVPTGTNNGECRITGLCMVMFYMESK